MKLDQSGLDLPDLGRGMAVLPDQHRKHLSHELGKRPILLDALDQPLKLRQTFGRDKPELGRIAADRVAHLGAPLEQALAHPDQHLARLLLHRLDRDEPLLDLRAAHRLRVAASFLPRSTYGLTYCGGIRDTSCPSARSSRAQ